MFSTDTHYSVKLFFSWYYLYMCQCGVSPEQTFHSKVSSENHFDMKEGSPRVNKNGQDSKNNNNIGQSGISSW